MLQLRVTYGQPAASERPPWRGSLQLEWAVAEDPHAAVARLRAAQAAVFADAPRREVVRLRLRERLGGEAGSDASPVACRVTVELLTAEPLRLELLRAAGTAGTAPARCAARSRRLSTSPR